MAKTVGGPGFFLPRTGIEQPFMRDRPRFKETHKEFESINTLNVSYFRNI